MPTPYRSSTPIPPAAPPRERFREAVAWWIAPRTRFFDCVLNVIGQTAFISLVSKFVEARIPRTPSGEEAPRQRARVCPWRRIRACDGRGRRYIQPVQLTAKTQLRATPEQSSALLATVRRVNEVRTWIACEAMSLPSCDRRRAFALHRVLYRAVRERFGLGAQMTVRAFASVAACFDRDPSTCPTFRDTAGIDYDARILSFAGDGVSIATLDSRERMPRVMGDAQRRLLDAGKHGASVLFPRKGRWYLHTAVDVVPAPMREPVVFLGVDLGIVNLAVDSDGTAYSGAAVERVRANLSRLRSELQSVGTRSARKRLAAIGQRESRFRADINHGISKRLVRCAEGTGRGIALEDLRGIRDRVTVTKAQRARHSGWAFAQLRFFLTYKAERAGVPVVVVDPRNTSRTCPVCSHCDKDNRVSRETFRCQKCGYEAPADFVGATNISRRAAFNRPDVPSEDRVKSSIRGRGSRVAQGQAPDFSRA